MTESRRLSVKWKDKARYCLLESANRWRPCWPPVKLK